MPIWSKFATKLHKITVLEQLGAGKQFLAQSDAIVAGLKFCISDTAQDKVILYNCYTLSEFQQKILIFDEIPDFVKIYIPDLKNTQFSNILIVKVHSC